MKKYWIIVEGKPQGPFTAEELKLRADFRADLPVWFSGLPEWTTVEMLPELAYLLTRPIDVTPVPPTPPRQQPQQQQPPVSPYARPYYDQTYRPQAQSEVWPQPEAPCPPTYMTWNILITLLCCLPVGIIGIVYSSKVRSRYMVGDLDGATKASEKAAWCLIIGLVLGLVMLPFQLFMPFM